MISRCGLISTHSFQMRVSVVEGDVWVKPKHLEQKMRVYSAKEVKTDQCSNKNGNSGLFNSLYCYTQV